jgi:hypothetical protein
MLLYVITMHRLSQFSSIRQLNGRNPPIAILYKPATVMRCQSEDPPTFTLPYGDSESCSSAVREDLWDGTYVTNKNRHESGTSSTSKASSGRLKEIVLF